MLKKKILALFFLLVLITGYFVTPKKTLSIECSQENIDRAKINRDTQALSELNISCPQAYEEALKKGNAYDKEKQRLVVQSYLTQLKIQETEQKIEATKKEIDTLENRIDNLDSSLNKLTELLRFRIVKEYKEKPVSVLTMVIDSTTANDFFTHFKYLKTAQENNQRLIVQVQQQKLNFEEQKVKREEKKKELDGLIITLDEQKIVLISQQAATEKLIKQARNDAAYFDNLRSQALSEYAAIRGIITGAGTETKLREVKKGETIAYLISGASCNSSGKHLHFMIKDGSNQVNPFNQLKSVSYRNCSGSSCDSGNGDPFNPGGSLDWPINEPIELEQGFGYTWAVANTWVGRIYSFHDGIDINGSSDNITAISDGDLYRGSYGVGCTLPYVKLVHRNSNITTYYLHVYSN